MRRANTAMRVVIGGGLLGLEAANGLKMRGMDVTVVHLNDWLMERQLDPTAAALLQKSLEARGIQFKLATQTEALVQGESGRVCAVRFKDGASLPAELGGVRGGHPPQHRSGRIGRHATATAASW